MIDTLEICRDTLGGHLLSPELESTRVPELRTRTNKDIPKHHGWARFFNCYFNSLANSRVIWYNIVFVWHQG